MITWRNSCQSKWRDDLKRREEAKSAPDAVKDSKRAAPESTDTDQSAPEAQPPESKTGEAGANGENWHERYLRLAAEFDNFRKRSAREFGDLVQNAERELIAELTEVLDNLDRAINQDHSGESLEEFAKGINLIRDQLWKVLGQRGLKRMDALGAPFDPEAHDALMRMPSEEYDEGCVAQEVAPGYRLGNRVLRHAKVIVSQGKPTEETSASDDDDDS